MMRADPERLPGDSVAHEADSGNTLEKEILIKRVC
jgi:hypothetical protein